MWRPASSHAVWLTRARASAAIPVRNNSDCFADDGDIVSAPTRSWHRTPASIALITLACLAGMLAAAAAAALCVLRCRRRRRDEDGLTSPDRNGGGGVSGKLSTPPPRTPHGAHGARAAPSNKLSPAGPAAHAGALHPGAGWGVEEAPAVPAGYGSTSVSPIFVSTARARSI